MRDYYEQLYTNKLDNLDEKDAFLKIRPNHEEIKNLNKLITTKEIETHTPFSFRRLCNDFS